MRVVQVIGRSTGGIGTHAVDLTEHLRALGDEVTVVTDSITAERFGLVDARRWWPSGPTPGSVRNLLRLRRLTRSSDVVHAHGHQAGLVAVLAATGTGVPVIVSQHNAVLAGGWRRKLSSRLLQRFVAGRAALSTGASSDLVLEAQRHGARAAVLAPVPSPRVPGLLAAEPLDRTTRAARRAALLQANGIAEEGPMVLTIARVAPQKNLDTIIDAASVVGITSTWIVVGDGDPDLLARLQTRARVEGAPVHFVGPQSDPGTWLQAAEVFVLTSTWEARALVVQEAMAAGVPVVSTDTGGLRDLVDGVGELVAVGDAFAVGSAVRGLLNDPKARECSAAAGRLRAAEWADGAATAQWWQARYAKVARRA
ncbi:putative glycosyl transferase [Janibacter sp. HTCC2649]|uniref:glycosyltransferase family 4 protein n=1 Tax=Janibacter sp. HTCC2649 TaxID=313589 RepID=UPI000066EAA2|nr:glycosyltransferase family 4 protein [Janibacter sp. HTCC2649]EAP99352.1 putative glycosyl transferase [Janibacter sp. HTCC2649]